MDAETRAELARLRVEMERLILERTRNIPSRWPQQPPLRQTVRIIGGNLQNGTQTIKYITDAAFVATAVYDPTVDTVYDDGLGYGYLCTPGVISADLVLVRNNCTSIADTVLGGDAFLVQGFSSITYGSTVMPVVLIDR